MTKYILDINHMSRRALLRSGGGVAAGVALGVSAGPVLAKPKRSQADVAYQDHPKGGERCDNCEPFIAPDQCKTVVGPISAKGWCKIYVAK